MSAIYKKGRARIEANLTPMIDMTFLLIVFFVLVSQISEIEQVKMELPRPYDPVSESPGDETRSVLNVVPGPDNQATAYKINAMEFPATPDGIVALTQHLTAMYQSNRDLNINLRADAKTAYEFVEPAMTAVSTAAASSGIEGLTARVNLVIIKERGF